ncbi:MAG: hypothetical protein SGI83_02260, partial [Bacteroidota bacterium]|nr:hypothetical protein [Bacteroidota bacterium]
YKFRTLEWEVNNGFVNPDALKQTVTMNLNQTLDKDILKIIGFELFLNNNNPIGRASMGMEINGKQIFPDDMQLFALYNNDFVAAKDRMIPINGTEGIEAGNGRIVIRYKDEYNPFIPFPTPDGLHYQYKVKMTLFCK